MVVAEEGPRDPVSFVHRHHHEHFCRSREATVTAIIGTAVTVTAIIGTVVTVTAIIETAGTVTTRSTPAGVEQVQSRLS